MKNNFAYVIILLFAASLCSCSDFISKDITGESVVTLSPVNGDTVTSYSQLFWWEEIQGAENYHLQIVRPSFTSIQQLLLDTLVAGDRFYFSLQPGTYQWRVRAQNNAGNTAYTTNTITIDSTLDLTSQAVQLIAPANNATVNNLTQTFSWYNMPLADTYTMQVLTGSNSIIYTGSNITGTSASYTFPSYGTYKWRVWAQNSVSSSHYMEWTINISTALSSPYLPANDDTLTGTSVSMSWTRPQGADIVSDSLIISKDISFTNIVHAGAHTGATYSFTSQQGQEYFWKLRSRSASGVMSTAYSSVYRFYVN